MTNDRNAGAGETASPMADPGDGGAAALAKDGTAAARTGADPANGLASVPHIVELADALSACADRLHERIMRDIRAHDARPVPDAVQAAARALLEDELILRQRANGLYADAATYIVKSLGKPQQGIVRLTTEAAEKIRKIAKLGDVAGLVAGLLSLAGAAATGQAVPIIMALDKIHTQIKALEKHSTPPATKPS